MLRRQVENQKLGPGVVLPFFGFVKTMMLPTTANYYIGGQLTKHEVRWHARWEIRNLGPVWSCCEMKQGEVMASQTVSIATGSSRPSDMTPPARVFRGQDS